MRTLPGEHHQTPPVRNTPSATLMSIDVHLQQINQLEDKVLDEHAINMWKEILCDKTVPYKSSALDSTGGSQDR
uniref:Uncharacterized protein n=1 Tax=Physcomitrium patens TaxID=3218 RepID=A0A2K1IRR8_PHYPA|nr:hypothetical protein PHYPA_026093 [Physcomitrium patens]